MATANEARQNDEWHSIVDGKGARGLVASIPADPSRVRVRLETGENLVVPRELVANEPDGTYRTSASFYGLRASFDGARTSGLDPLVVPIVEEQAHVEKHVVARENVQVSTSVTARDEQVNVTLFEEDIAVQRVAVGQVVNEASGPRQEGDVLIVPIYEEVLFVEKRLVLREEVRVTRLRRERQEHQSVTLRREDVHVERTALEDGER